jgi:pimeloyl-ACP methyl ester carboxylesterase
MKKVRLLLPLLALPLLLLLLRFHGDLSVGSARLANGASFEPTSCWFRVPFTRRVECGLVTTRGMEHRLPVVIVRDSWFSNDTSPVVFIQGGPGGAAGLDALAMEWWLEDIERYDWGRDFVLYDQRGTGLAQPSLACPEVLEGMRRDLQLALRPDEENARYLGYLRACHDRLRGEGLRLDDYSTAANSDDLADIIKLVQPGSWTLYAASYGTRIALETERRHPQLVRDMVLDSVYPHDKDGFLSWPGILARGVDRVLEHGGRQSLKPVLAEVMQRLDQEPLRLPVSRYSGEPYTPVLTGTRIYMALFAATYSSDMIGHIAPVIGDLAAGSRRSAALTEVVTFAVELELDATFSEPVFHSVSCREDQVRRESDYLAEVEIHARAYPQLRRMLLDHSPADVCAFWESGSVPAGFREPVVTGKPVLLLGGELDAITPVEWAREMHDYLPASRLVVVPGGGHAVTVTDVCTMLLARDFLADPAAALPMQCNGDG